VSLILSVVMSFVSPVNKDPCMDGVMCSSNKFYSVFYKRFKQSMTSCCLCDNIGGPYDSNANHQHMDSTCSCWFCSDCLQDMYDDGVIECYRCKGDIETLVGLTAYYNDFSSDTESTEQNCCQVCDRFPAYDSNANMEIQSACQHWFCSECLQEFYEDGVVTCPSCHGDIEDLVGEVYRWTNETDEEDTEPSRFMLEVPTLTHVCAHAA
jgi:predicted nucleic acid-binding Zn ribbon protein